MPKLAGRHQHVNAGTAIAALRAAGYGGLPSSAFEQGMLNADWPARLQRIARGKLAELVPGRAELWLDGGHNPDGGRVLAQAMADLADRNPAPLVMIAGLLSTKDAGATLGHFKGLAQLLFAVPLQNNLAARPAEEVLRHPGDPTAGDSRRHGWNWQARRGASRAAARPRRGYKCR